jgi:AraC-like DNA-binding protein
MNGMLGFMVIQTLTFTFIPSEIRSLSLHLTFITILIISNYYLLFHPEILYGLPKLTHITLSGLENIQVGVKKKKINTPLLNSSLAKNEIPEERIGPPLLNEYKIQVNDYIIQSAVYLNPDLSIFDLSRATTIPVHHLRLLINKNTGQRFNDFINEYRIQHMQTLINNGALLNKTLETLAFECGFSSKPAFIRGVKKLTNQTPGAYFKPKKSSASKGIP